MFWFSTIGVVDAALGQQIKLKKCYFSSFWSYQVCTSTLIVTNTNQQISRSLLPCTKLGYGTASWQTRDNQDGGEASAEKRWWRLKSWLCIKRTRGSSSATRGKATTCWQTRGKWDERHQRTRGSRVLRGRGCESWEQQVVAVQHEATPQPASKQEANGR